ncbi:MAG TPA: mannose-1-phosphate guanylyltransferase/mannose-6-phosphate isomerase, partial [Hyphomonadaceae bacterium]|nr:mannose-1-phosphate guanylyltransferase/mannose-6-phosphate isomerase [Hyphomonadaceae bacterium]
MKPCIIPAILSGGAGTRLWPVSTDANPKQFHLLAGGASLLAQTVLRVAGETDAVAFAPPIILASAAHVALVEEHLGGSAVSALVIEPAGRNTAAPAVIAAALAAEITPDALVLLLPADHLIADREAFLAALARAAAFARDRIVTFGVTPNRPATGYG